MLIVSLGLLYDSNYEDLVKSSPYGVVSSKAKQVYTIGKTIRTSSTSTQANYQPFTSSRLLSIQFNVYKFINRLIYGTRRYQELFPPISKLVELSNSKQQSTATDTDAKDASVFNQGRSNFPINCAVDDLDLMFDGGDQISIFDSAIDDLHRFHPQHHHQHHQQQQQHRYGQDGHIVGYSTHRDPHFGKNGYEEEEKYTPVFQHHQQQQQQQQQKEQAKQEKQKQDPFKQEVQRTGKFGQICSQPSPASELPIFDDFIEAHQHRYHLNNNNNNGNSNSNNNDEDDFFLNAFNEREVNNQVDRDTFASFSRDVFANQSTGDNNDKDTEYPYFDDFEHHDPTPNRPITTNKGHNSKQGTSTTFIENALISSSVSSTESFLSPLDDEILSRLHRPSPQDSVVIPQGTGGGGGGGVNSSFQFGQAYYFQSGDDNDDDVNSDFFEVESSSLPKRDIHLVRPYSHSISLPHSQQQSRFQPHVSSSFPSAASGFDRFNSFHHIAYTKQHHHQQQQHQQQHQQRQQVQRHYLEGFKLSNLDQFGGARHNDVSSPFVVPSRKRKLSSSGLSITSPSVVSSFDSDVPVSPTDTVMKPVLKRESPTRLLKCKQKKNKKVKLEHFQQDKSSNGHNNRDARMKNSAAAFTNAPVVVATSTTKTINTTVRKLSYTGKDGKVGYSFECPHCNSQFKVKGYLTRHLKKHSSSKAFQCPFYQETDPSSQDDHLSCTLSTTPSSVLGALGVLGATVGTKCHPTGGFNRRDTFKTHLKALHFIYPPGTKSTERNLLSGRCAGCFQFFENNSQWLVQHIETGLCQGTVEYKQKLRQSIEEEKGGRQINVKKEKRDGSSRDDDDGVEEGDEGEVDYLLGSDDDNDHDDEDNNFGAGFDEDGEECASGEKTQLEKKVTVKKEPVM